MAVDAQVEGLVVVAVEADGLQGLAQGGVGPLGLGRRRRRRLVRRGGEAGERPPGHPEFDGAVAHLGKREVGAGAEHAAQIDGHDIAGGGIGPARLEELLARRDEIVRAGADALGVERRDDRGLRQDVEEGLHPVDEGRRERLHALDGDALGDLGEHVGDTGQPLRQVEGTLAHLRGEEQLAARRRPQAVGGDLDAALVGDLEEADLLDLVAEELDADRVLLGGREDVEHPAADGEFAAPLDEIGPRVGSGGERVDDVGERPLLPLAQRHGREIPEPDDDRLE